MLAIRERYENTNHLFCSWHINNNVLVNCKKAFSDKEAWTRFFGEWKTIMYAFSEAKFWELWDKFFDKYDRSHEDCVKYLSFIYIVKRRHFAKCYIDKILHFGIIVTSRSESNYAILKRQLKSSIEDLKIVINKIRLLLINQLHNHFIEFEEARTRFSSKLRKSIFNQLVAFVSSYALKKILNQYNLVINQSTALSVCIDVFIITLRLSCAHKIENRMWKTESLLLMNVHAHWRLISY
jgi:hypothetical protein